MLKKFAVLVLMGYLTILYAGDNMRVKVVLDMKAKSTLVPQYMLFLEENLPNVRGFDGCKSVEVYFNKETNEMAINEIWESKTHHQNYIKFISQNGVMGKLVSFLESEPIVRYYNILTL